MSVERSKLIIAASFAIIIDLILYHTVKLEAKPNQSKYEDGELVEWYQPFVTLAILAMHCYFAIICAAISETNSFLYIFCVKISIISLFSRFFN